MALFRQPLFNARLLKKKLPLAPTPPRHKQLLHDWAATIRDGSLARQKESAVRGVFLQRLFHEVLGYQPFGGGTTAWSIEEESSLGPGPADAALGHTRQAYETWDIRDVADKDSEYQRLCFLLGAANLLSGATAKLLTESQEADKEITRRFDAGLRNFHRSYKRLVNFWQLADNSVDQPRLLDEGSNP